MKWLVRTPKSPHQVLAVINEANEEYARYKSLTKKMKEKAQENYIKQGVRVGARVKVLTDVADLKDHEFIVVDVKGEAVHVKNPFTGQKWRIRGFKFEVLK